MHVGDLVSDPGALILTAYKIDLSNPFVFLNEKTALVEALGEPPTGGRLNTGPEDISVAGASGVFVRYKFSNGTEEELAFVFLADAIVKVDALRWPAFGDVVPRGYAVQVLDSLQRL